MTFEVSLEVSKIIFKSSLTSGNYANGFLGKIWKWFGNAFF